MKIHIEEIGETQTKKYHITNTYQFVLLTAYNGWCIDQKKPNEPKKGFRVSLPIKVDGVVTNHWITKTKTKETRIALHILDYPVFYGVPFEREILDRPWRKQKGMKPKKEKAIWTYQI